MFDIEAMQAGVVTGASPSLALTMDESIGPPVSSDVVCSSASPLRLCEGPILSSSVSRTDLSIVVRLASHSVAVEAVYVEILQGELGTVRARAFVVQEPDTDMDPPPQCQLALPARIVDGALRWNGRTDGDLGDLHGELELTLEDGHWARASF